VFYSSRNLWQKAIQKFCLQKVSPQQREEIIFSHYAYLAEQYKKDKHLIPAGNIVEVLYEDLELKPLAVLKKIYKQLNMHGFQNAYENFINQLEKEKHYRKFKYSYDEGTSGKIEQHWPAHIHEWKKNVSDSRSKTMIIS
jgi:hypothetical protein